MIAIAIVTVFESLLIANHVHVSFERHARHSHIDISNSSQHYFLFHLFLTQHNMSDEHNTDASATQDVPSYVSNIVAYVDCSVSDGSNSIRDMTCHRMDRGESYHPCFGNIQAAVDYLIHHDDEDVCDGNVQRWSLGYFED